MVKDSQTGVPQQAGGPRASPPDRAQPQYLANQSQFPGLVHEVAIMMH